MSNARSIKLQQLPALQGMVITWKHLTQPECLALWTPGTAYEPDKPVIGINGKQWQPVKLRTKRIRPISSSSQHTR
jgi:hypothetical protein